MPRLVTELNAPAFDSHQSLPRLHGFIVFSMAQETAKDAWLKKGAVSALADKVGVEAEGTLWKISG